MRCSTEPWRDDVSVNSDATPPGIRQQVTWVYTRDLDDTCRFYAGLLGLSLVLDQGSCRIFRAATGAFIGVCRARPGREVAPAGVVITLVSDDVDGWYEHLRAAGAAIEAPPHRSEAFNVYSFFVLDPNGYRVEIQAFLDPTWPAT